jgi:hypothetical protein
MGGTSREGFAASNHTKIMALSKERGLRSQYEQACGCANCRHALKDPQRKKWSPNLFKHH